MRNKVTLFFVSFINDFGDLELPSRKTMPSYINGFNTSFRYMLLAFH